MKTYEQLKEEIRWSQFIPDIDELRLDEDLLGEMARIDPSLSGTKVVIFVSSQQYVGGSHWARVKVSNIYGKWSRDDNFSVSISRIPRVVAGKPKIKNSDLDDVYDWIVLNYDQLIRYWKDGYSDLLQFTSDLDRV